MSFLHTLPSLVAKAKKRLGRGHGSGKGGHTVGRGTKGKGARVGRGVPLWFEGGQLPLGKRLPMQRGKGRFNVIEPTAEVSLSQLNKMKSDTITLDSLKLEGVVDHRFTKAKIIAGSQLKRKLTVSGIKVSAAAAKAIVEAGGSVV